MKGDLIAYFNETVATTHEPMLQLAASITRDPHLARDACQEAYLEFFLALNRRKAIANRGAWLRRVVINKALAVARRRKAGVGAPLDALDGLEPAVAEDSADEGTVTALRAVRVLAGEPRFFGPNPGRVWLTGAVAEHPRRRLPACLAWTRAYGLPHIRAPFSAPPRDHKQKAWFNPMGVSGGLPSLQLSTVSGDSLRDSIGRLVNFPSDPCGRGLLR